MDEQEVKNVTISPPTFKKTFSSKDQWEEEWEKINAHLPNNRQKARRMAREWEKYFSKQME